MRNTHWFSTATVVSQTHHNVAFICTLPVLFVLLTVPPSCPGSNSVWPLPLPTVYYFQCIYSLILVSGWNVMAHGDSREGNWRGNWRMEWVPVLFATSERGVSSITNAEAHTSAASNRLNWRPCGFVRFAERRNLVSARVPSHFKRSLPLDAMYLHSVIKWTSCGIECDNRNWNWPFSTKSWNEIESKDGKVMCTYTSSL
jgi:hypothetical protein